MERSEIQLVGWVERSETHRGLEKDDGFRFALPILRAANRAVGLGSAKCHRASPDAHGGAKPGKPDRSASHGDRESGGARRSASRRCRCRHQSRQEPWCRKESFGRLQKARAGEPPATDESVGRKADYPNGSGLKWPARWAIRRTRYFFSTKICWQSASPMFSAECEPTTTPGWTVPAFASRSVVLPSAAYSLVLQSVTL